MASLSGTVVVNSGASTLVDSELGTMVINDTEDEDDSTMKRGYTVLEEGCEIRPQKMNLNNPVSKQNKLFKTKLL